ncbi:MAG: DUF5926 family protein [Arcanobacterium sp.]|nr:DUF5926 family protein [Arcanobacterium sp.]
MGKKSRRNKEAKPKRIRIQFVERPFEGLSFETELVAMREILPAATLKVRTNSEYGNEELLIVSMLPQMVGAVRRSDGVLLVAMQTVMNSGDLSLDVADRIIQGLELQPSETFNQIDEPQSGIRLQDVLDLDFASEFTLAEDLAFWVGVDELEDPQTKQAIAQTKDQLIATKEINGVKGAYWTKMQRLFLRWVRPEAQDTVLNAIARLQNRRELNFGEARFVGAFRALGLLIPVFELADGVEADDLAAPLAEFAQKLDAAISDETPLDPEERRAKAGIISRQVTLR